MTNYDSYPSSARSPEATGPKRLTRSSTDKVLGGVCGGFASYVGVDANLIRIALVALTIFGVGTGVILYLVAWALMPQH